MGNLADPDFEPSDEDLQELSRQAFAHVAASKKRMLEDLRKKIAEERRRLTEEFGSK